MLMTNTNIPAAKVAKNAKAKTATKAERLRANMTKANAKAAKALPGASFDDLAVALVTKANAADGAARTMAHYMNNTFAEQMKAFRCHWSAFTPANCRTDNEKAILAAINDKRKMVQELAEKRGLANVNKPWSDMRKIAVELFHGGRKVERTAKPLDTVQLDLLTKLYKAAMKEERPTENELAINDMIGRALVQYFKVDLSKLG